MATIVQASISGAPMNDILTECRQFPGSFARWVPVLGRLVSLSQWFDQSQEIVNSDLGLVQRELGSLGKYKKSLFRHWLKADEIQQS